MIRLHQEDLQAMYPSMSAEFSARMDALVHALPAAKEDKPMKRISRTLIFAMVLLLTALSTTAYALTCPAVLDWLLGAGSAPSPQLEHAAQDIHSESTADGVTVRLTGLVYDGTQLALSYEVENAAPTQPVLVRPAGDIVLNGQTVPVPHARQDAGRLVPSPHMDVLPARRNPIADGLWCTGLPEGLNGQVRGEITLIVCRPAMAYAVLIEPDSMLLDDSISDPAVLAEAADARATLDSFTNAELAEAAWTEADVWSDRGYTVLDESGSPIYPMDDPRSHTLEATRITLPFTFDADNAFCFDFSGATAMLDDYEAEVRLFRLTALSTRLDVLLVPDINTREAALALADALGPVILTDESGAPVAYSGMDAMFDERPYVTQMNNRWVCRYLAELPGLQVFPASIGVTVQGGELLRFDLNAE